MRYGYGFFNQEGFCFGISKLPYPFYIGTKPVKHICRVRKLTKRNHYKLVKFYTHRYGVSATKIYN